MSKDSFDKNKPSESTKSNAYIRKVNRDKGAKTEEKAPNIMELLSQSLFDERNNSPYKNNYPDIAVEKTTLPLGPKSGRNFIKKESPKKESPQKATKMGVDDSGNKNNSVFSSPISFANKSNPENSSLEFQYPSPPKAGSRGSVDISPITNISPSEVRSTPIDDLGNISPIYEVGQQQSKTSSNVESSNGSSSIKFEGSKGSSNTKTLPLPLISPQSDNLASSFFSPSGHLDSTLQPHSDQLELVVEDSSILGSQSPINAAQHNENSSILGVISPINDGQNNEDLGDISPIIEQKNADQPQKKIKKVILLPEEQLQKPKPQDLSTEDLSGMNDYLTETRSQIFQENYKPKNENYYSESNAKIEFELFKEFYEAFAKRNLSIIPNHKKIDDIGASEIDNVQIALREVLGDKFYEIEREKTGFKTEEQTKYLVITGSKAVISQIKELLENYQEKKKNYDNTKSNNNIEEESSTQPTAPKPSSNAFTRGKNPKSNNNIKEEPSPQPTAPQSSSNAFTRGRTGRS